MMQIIKYINQLYIISINQYILNINQLYTIIHGLNIL